MINIAIVEDEAMYAKQLQEFLLQYQKENGEVFNITVYSDGDQIVHKYKSQFDIILMDVEMKFMDGMSAAEEIRKADTEVVIIFITNMAQYAIRGYAVDALDYVLKPVSYFAFSQRLNRAISRMKKREQKVITVNIKGGAVRINIANIYYIESQGHNLVLHTILGDYESAGTMKEVEEKLQGLNFCRGNKGYLINLQHVDGIQDGCAVVKGEPLLLEPLAQERVYGSTDELLGRGCKMMEHLMPDIPRIYTAAAEWMACMLFIVSLKKRFEWWKSGLIMAGMLVLQSVFLVATGNVPIYFWIPCMIAAVSLMVGFIYFCCDVNFQDAGYFGMIAFVVAEFMASLEWQIVCTVWTNELPGKATKSHHACGGLWCSILFIVEIIAAASSKRWKAEHQL